MEYIDYIKHALNYGNERLKTQIFHELTNNRYKSGLELLAPLYDIDSVDGFKDYSGNDHHGTPTNVSVVGNGESKSAYANGDLPTDDQYITFTGINPGTDDFSISMVFNTLGGISHSTNLYMFHGYTSGSNQCYLAPRTGGTFRGNVNGANADSPVLSLGTSPHFVTLSVDRSANMELFLDGVLQDTASVSSTSATDMQTNTWKVFKRDIGTLSWLNGNVKWLMFHIGRIITIDEHRELNDLLKPSRFAIQ